MSRKSFLMIARSIGLTLLASLVGCGRKATELQTEVRETPMTAEPSELGPAKPKAEVDKPSPEAAQHYRAGLRFKHAEDYDSAVRELTKAVKSAPDYAEAHFVLAWVWMGKKETKQAILEFQEVLRIAPDSKQGKGARAALARLGVTVTATPAKSPSRPSAASQTPPTAPSEDRSASLVSLVRQGEVQATVTAIGGSSGDTVRLKLRRTVDRTIRANLPAGTVLRSTSPGVQDMVVCRVRGVAVDKQRFRPTDSIVLTSGAPVTYVVEAYCLDFDKDNPSAGNGFALAAPRSKMSRLLARAKKEGADVRATQAAVWLSQGVSTSQIQQRFPVSNSQLSTARKLMQSGAP